MQQLVFRVSKWTKLGFAMLAVCAVLLGSIMYAALSDVVEYPGFLLAVACIFPVIAVYRFAQVYSVSAELAEDAVVFRRRGSEIGRYPFGSYSFDAEKKSGRDFAGTFSGGGYTVTVTNDSGFKKTHFLPLGKKDFQLLLSGLEKASLMPEAGIAQDEPISFKEYVLNKGSLRWFAIGAILSLAGASALAAFAWNTYIAPGGALWDINEVMLFLLIALMLTAAAFAVQWFQYGRKMPDKVIIRPGFITFGDRTIPLGDIRSVKAASPLQKGGTGGRKIEIVTSKGKDVWFLGMHKDRKPGKGILPLSDYDEIFKFLKKQLESKPEAFVSEMQK